MTKDKSMEKKVMIVGGTSFVGRRFLSYYHDYFLQNKIQVIVTARNLENLKDVTKRYPHYQIVQLNTLEKEKVLSTIVQVNVVINFTGPFDLYSENIVEACALHGIDYLDITGEVYFSKRMRKKFEEIAIKNKSRIISFAGFDSVPSDFMTYNALMFAKEQGSTLSSLDHVYKMKGGFNGGTLKTAFEMANKMTDEENEDRNYLTDKSSFPQKDTHKMRFIEEKKMWASPFFMESINSKVIYRSLELLKSEFVEDDFSYRESIPLPGGMLSNATYSYSTKFAPRMFKNKLTSNLLKKVLPKPGEGPSEDLIESGFVKSFAIARLKNGVTGEAKLFSSGDPGNKSTCKFLASLMKGLLKGKALDSWGFQTPVSAFRDNLPLLLKEEGVDVSAFTSIH